MSGTIPDVYELKSVPGGDLKTAVQLAKEQLGVHPVITVPKGVINPESVRRSIADLGTMLLTEDGFGGAAPHDHGEPSCLVSLDCSVTTPTAIFHAQEAVNATVALLESGWRKIIEDLITKLPASWNYEQKFASAIADLEQHKKNPLLGALNVHQNSQERWSLERIRTIVSNIARSVPDASILIHRFIAEVQESISSSTMVIQWPDNDLLMFHGDMIHGRQVTTRPNRLSTEKLYMVLSGVRHRGSH